MHRNFPYNSLNKILDRKDRYMIKLGLGNLSRLMACNSQSSATKPTKYGINSSVGNYGRLKLGSKQFAYKYVPLLALTLFILGVLPINESHARNCVPNHFAAQVMQKVRNDLTKQSIERTNAHWYSTADPLQAKIAYEILSNDGDAPAEMQQIHFLNINNEVFVLLLSDNNQTCGFADLIVVDDALGRQAITESEALARGSGRIPDETDETANNNNTRSTQPGDPLFNMSDEERKAFQAIQGILNGQNPNQGLQELFKNQ